MDHARKSPLSRKKKDTDFIIDAHSYVIMFQNYGTCISIFLLWNFQLQYYYVCLFSQYILHVVYYVSVYTYSSNIDEFIW